MVSKREQPTISPPPEKQALDSVISDLYSQAEEQLDMATRMVKRAGELREIARRIRLSRAGR